MLLQTIAQDADAPGAHFVADPAPVPDFDHAVPSGVSDRNDEDVSSGISSCTQGRLAMNSLPSTVHQIQMRGSKGDEGLAGIGD